ncbi:Aminoacylase-1 [Symbiodinium microadriaticum]|uniref:N-acyl-aliphatic-L-amino acid amidohydrolase n=1 Tax=Symbiodinium microadriaticum TaxID=2951 RepID=A0A1Q9CTU4_SYMMI|nr:Aminoacylase-1 [Symbiodinium microadriaticum]
MPDTLPPEAELFRDFLRIRSVSGEGPQGSYAEAVAWLTAQCRRLGLTTKQVEPVKGKPILLATWAGSDDSLPCLLLNSHYDVVPAMTECWSVDPWAAEVVDGRIYGRGTQDMKSVCVQYLFAIERLRKRGFVPLRTIHLSFVPDEEIGGVEGMGELLKTPEFNALGEIGLALDEGLSNPGDAFTVFYGERTPWWLLVRATGPTGHGSRFIKNTAPQKLLRFAERALAFRKAQEDSLGHGSNGCKHGTAKKLGDVTTVNLTMLRCGVSNDNGKTFCLNVIPTEAEAGFDVRITPDLKPKDFKNLLDQWCKEDEGITWQIAPWTRAFQEHHTTATDESNPWWVAFRDAMSSMSFDIEPEVFPAATDSRFLRELGIPALGFSPMRRCPILLHEHDEYLPVDVFMSGIDVYVGLIDALASKQKLQGEDEDVQRGSKPKGFGSSAPRFRAKTSEVPGPGSYSLPRLFDAPSPVMKKTRKLPAFFEEPGNDIEMAPLQKVITEDGPDNTDWEDVQDTTQAWFIASYTTPLPTLSDDRMAEIDEIVARMEGGL